MRNREGDDSRCAVSILIICFDVLGATCVTAVTAFHKSGAYIAHSATQPLIDVTGGNQITECFLWSHKMLHLPHIVVALHMI